MDTLSQLSRLIDSLESDVKKVSSFEKVIEFFVEETSWSAVSNEISKSDITAEKLGLKENEITYGNEKNSKSKSNVALAAFQKAMCKKLSHFLTILGRHKESQAEFEKCIVPLLVLSAGIPLKYLPADDPFGCNIHGANDCWKSGKEWLYAPASFKSQQLPKIAANALTRPLIIPLVQFAIKRYVTKDRLEHATFIVECLRFAVHFEDVELKVLRSSFWELAMKVAASSVDSAQYKSIFDQLNTLIWHDNGEECTRAVLTYNSSPSKSLVMPRHEAQAHLALLKAINRRITASVRIKSVLRETLGTVMKSVIYRKSGEEVLDIFKMIESWLRVGKEGPIELTLVRMMLGDTLEVFDAFLTKARDDSLRECTFYLMRMVDESLATYTNTKSILKRLESFAGHVTTAIYGDVKGKKDCSEEFSKRLCEVMEESEEKEKTPSSILFRSVSARAFLRKVKVLSIAHSDVGKRLLKRLDVLAEDVVNALKENSDDDYVNECVPYLAEVVSIWIEGPVDEEKQWMWSLFGVRFTSMLLEGISLMKNKNARKSATATLTTNCSAIAAWMREKEPNSTISVLEPFFLTALTVDLPEEARKWACDVWKGSYEGRIEQLEGVAMSSALVDRLKWFQLPTPKNTVSDALEAKKEQSPTKGRKRGGAVFSSPAPIKKTKNVSQALKYIDLMDEDSVSYFPVESSPKKKQRMTEKQKEMLMEKKDHLPYIEEESISGIPKMPSDIFEMSISHVESTSKAVAPKADMKTDFSHLMEDPKSATDEKTSNLEVNRREDREEESSTEESMSSVKQYEDDKGRGRRKAKAPVKILLQEKESWSPARKKHEMRTADSLMRKSKRLEKTGEEGDKEAKRGRRKKVIDEEEQKKVGNYTEKNRKNEIKEEEVEEVIETRRKVRRDKKSEDEEKRNKKEEEEEKKKINEKEEEDKRKNKIEEKRKRKEKEEEETRRSKEEEKSKEKEEEETRRSKEEEKRKKEEEKMRWEEEKRVKVEEENMRKKKEEQEEERKKIEEEEARKRKEVEEEERKIREEEEKMIMKAEAKKKEEDDKVKDAEIRRKKEEDEKEKKQKEIEEGMRKTKEEEIGKREMEEQDKKEVEITTKSSEIIMIEDDDAPLPPLDTPSSTQSSTVEVEEERSPIKEDVEQPLPGTPANRGNFEPVGILSSSKKGRSEKKKGGVHFNVSSEVATVKENKEEEEMKEGERSDKKEEETDRDERVVFSQLKNCEDSIDSIVLKLGGNSRMLKMSLEKAGVRTIGELAAMSAKEINGIMGIKPPKLRTVESVLEGVLTRHSKARPATSSNLTPEKNVESTVAKSPLKRIITPLLACEGSPVTRSSSPRQLKSKSRKRLALSDSPMKTKKIRVEDEDGKGKNDEELEQMTNGSAEDEGKANDAVVRRQNKENDFDSRKEESVQGAQISAKAVTTVDDVMAFIAALKEGPMENLLAAHEKITLSLIDAIREAKNL